MAVLLLLLFLVPLAAADTAGDKQALLDFLSRVPHSSRVVWNATSAAAPCDWFGVKCDPAGNTVEFLRLPGSGLVGPIPPGTLSRLSGLRVLSLRANGLTGPIPTDLASLTHLRSLYLQNNRLSGEIPPQVSRIARMTRLDLSRNDLSGEIPFALNNLTQLTGLFLQENRFTGSIPSINVPSLLEFNVSHNRLNGSVPDTLTRFPVSCFAGNLNLCGGPLPSCSPFFPSPGPAPAVAPPGGDGSGKKKKLSTAAIIAIAVAGGAVLLLLALLLLVCCIRRRRGGSGGKAAAPAKGAVGGGAAPRSGEMGMTSSSLSKDDPASGGAAGAEGERNRLVFVGKGGAYSFDLEDLLRASAEVLGKGSVGTSYKAVLEDGTTTVVVKRLKDVVVSRREFEQHMDSIGRVEHPNLLPLRAYYYSKDEKLLVFDFLAAGSLSALLHGSRGSGRTPLDWDSRMRIAVAAGRGLAHLHDTARVVHGDIKASNVLLHPDPDAAALTDYGLAPLFGSTVPPVRVAGYRAPEVVETRRPTVKSDVYSFGVLLLELLTGKSPNQALAAGEDGIDLPRWVQSVVREEWTAEVFDVELMRYPNIEEEMVQVLQVAMACVATVPDARPDAREVVRMMEDVVRRAEPASSDDPSKGGSGGRTPPAGATP